VRRVGALISGALVQYAPAPTRLTYGVILVATVALAVLAHRVIDDTTTPRYRPRLNIDVHVPPAVRPTFYAALPCLLSAWAVSGFYLSLGPSVANALTGQDNALVGGGTVAVLTGCSTMGAVAANRLAPRAAMLCGCGFLIAGATLTSAAVAFGSAAMFFGSTSIAGLGFGAAYLGANRSLVDLAGPAQRGAVLSAILIVAYLGMSVPSIIAGVVASHVDLRLTAMGFGLAVAALAEVSVAAMLLTPAYRAPDLDSTSTPRAGPACSTDPVPAPRRMPDNNNNNNNALATPQPG
jgi:MFS family permease